MARDGTVLCEQAAAYVRSGERVALVTWVLYRHDGAPRTELTIWKVVRTLLPGDRVAQGVTERASGVTRGELEAWLGARGYEVLSIIDAPRTDEALKLW